MEGLLTPKRSAGSTVLDCYSSFSLLYGFYSSRGEQTGSHVRRRSVDGERSVAEQNIYTRGSVYANTADKPGSKQIPDDSVRQTAGYLPDSTATRTWLIRPTQQMSDNWDDVSFVISSQYRVMVLRRLATGPATPSQIASDVDVGIAHVSRALQRLREKELVDLLVSEDRKKGRVYGLTERGRGVWDTIEAENMI